MVPSITRRIPLLFLSILLQWGNVLTAIRASNDIRTLDSDSLRVSLGTGVYLGEITPNGTERWLGVQFAQPPLGPLRFKAPLYPKASQTVQNATKFGNACPQLANSQLNAPIGEDCLTLNVSA